MLRTKLITSCGVLGLALGAVACGDDGSADAGDVGGQANQPATGGQPPPVSGQPPPVSGQPAPVNGSPQPGAMPVTPAPVMPAPVMPAPGVPAPQAVVPEPGVAVMPSQPALPAASGTPVSTTVPAVTGAPAPPPLAPAPVATAPVVAVPKGSCDGALVKVPGITDFSDFVGADFGDPSPDALAGGMSGGIYSYGTTTSTHVDMLTLAGSVADYSGAGLFFNYCFNASAYSGVSFTLSGELGQGLNVRVHTNSNKPVESVVTGGVTVMRGDCVPADPAAPWVDCAYAQVKISEVGTGMIQIPWADFAGGKPSPGADPTEVVGIEFTPAFNGATPFDVNLTIDDIAFY